MVGGQEQAQLDISLISRPILAVQSNEADVRPWRNEMRPFGIYECIYGLWPGVGCREPKDTWIHAMIVVGMQQKQAYPSYLLFASLLSSSLLFLILFSALSFSPLFSFLSLNP